MKNKLLFLLRFLIFIITYVLFWIISTKLYFDYLHDVGATFWSVGIFGLPVILIIYIIIDLLINKFLKSKIKKIILFIINNIFCVFLYYPTIPIVFFINEILR